jgi:hypothetical protein
MFGDDPCASRRRERRRRAAVIAAAAVFLLLWVFLIARGLHKGGVFRDGKFNDFRAYHLAAGGVLAGDLVPSYEDRERPNQYPPPFAFLAAPLGLLPYRAAAAAWVLLKALLVLWIFRGLDRILGVPLPALAKLAGFLATYRLIESDFANGNANLPVLALVLWGFDLTRRGWDRAGGGALAAAALAKASPVLTLPWILYRARWRELAGFVAAALLLVGLLPLLVLGPRGTLDAWRAWERATITAVAEGAPAGAGSGTAGSGYEPGQSLRAFVHRLLRPSDATAHDEAAVSVHVAELSRLACDALYLAAAAVILALLLAAAWRRAPGFRLGWGGPEIAAACAALALLAPLSRKAHFVFLWPAAALGFEAWRRSEGRRVQAVGAALWFGAVVLIVASSPGALGRELSTRVLAYCPIGWAAAFLLVLVSHPRFFPRGGRTVKELGRPC